MTPIEGTKKERRQAYRWCEIYGLDKRNVMSTDWQWSYEACVWYNKTEYPEKNRRNLYKRKVK